MNTRLMHPLIRLALSASFILLLAPRAPAQTFKTLYNFTARSVSSPFTNSDGAYPRADLIRSGNTLFGTASQGGSSGKGTVFSINTNGNGFTVLYSFTALSNSTNSDGAIPEAGLLLSGNALFGAAAQGGNASYGTLFSVTIPITLFYQRIGSVAVLSWNGPAFVLQAAPAVTGNYTNIPTATSPFTNTIASPQQFFRLLVSQ